MIWIIVIIIIFIVLALIRNKNNKPILTEEYEKEKDTRFIYCTIAGTFYRDFEQIERAKLLRVGELLRLKKEPNNPYDKNAIKVLTKDNVHIGYIPAVFCSDVKQFIQEHPQYKVEVENVFKEGVAPYIDICIKYAL